MPTPKEESTTKITLITSLNNTGLFYRLYPEGFTSLTINEKEDKKRTFKIICLPDEKLATDAESIRFLQESKHIAILGKDLSRITEQKLIEFFEEEKEISHEVKNKDYSTLTKLKNQITSLCQDLITPPRKPKRQLTAPEYQIADVLRQLTQVGFVPEEAAAVFPR